MKYVQRRANRFEFRFPLPDDLAGRPVSIPYPAALVPLVNAKTARFKTELIRSLQTREPRTAERAALSHIDEAHRLIDAARSFVKNGPVVGVSPLQMANLTKAQEVRFLQGDEHLRRQGLGLDFSRPDTPVHHDMMGMTDDDLRLYQHVVDQLNTEARDQLARMRPDDATSASVTNAVREAGLNLHPDDPAWRELELEFLKARRDALDQIKARLSGDDVPTPMAFDQVSTITLSAALERWQTGGGRGARRPQAGSAHEASRAVQQFIELHGDLPIDTITKAHARAYRDALAQLPKALPTRFRRVPLPELVKCDLSKYAKRNVQTINKTLALLGGILTRAERDGFLETFPSWSNPFHVRFDIHEADREPYEPFSTEELQRLFASPVFHGARPIGGKGEAAYWFPLIALFTGARRTEIAQLHTSDIRMGEHGIWYFDFTNEGEGQTLKTVSSARSVPVHSELIRLGFLEFMRLRITHKKTEDLLWAKFNKPVHSDAKAWTKWFGRYLAKHVVDRPSKTFHSFRHTFKRACREAGISEEVHHAVTGHSGGGVGRRYGRERRADGSLDRGISLERLAVEINKVVYRRVQLPVQHPELE